MNIVVVLCDGHDLHGHMVAREVSEMLAPLIITSLNKTQEVDLDHVDMELAIIAAFDALILISFSLLSIYSFSCLCLRYSK